MKRIFLSIFAIFAMSSAFATEKQTLDVNQLQNDAAVVCDYYEEFKKFNKVFCAAAKQVSDTAQKVMVPKTIACAYPSVRNDLRMCPASEVKLMNLPDMPYMMQVPQWPVGLKPLMTVVNGKALNEALKMHEALFNNEYEVSAYCVSKDGILKQTDRILCAPYVTGLALIDPTEVPTYNFNAWLPFASNSIYPENYEIESLRSQFNQALQTYEAKIKKLGLEFVLSKVKLKDVKIVGRADKSGASSTNWEFSKQRAYATSSVLKSILLEKGLSAEDAHFNVDWIGDSESYCYEEHGDAVCVTEDKYGNFVSGRRGWRVSKGSNDRCYKDEWKKNGWIYPKKTVCDASDRDSRIEVLFKFELFDSKDVEIEALRKRLQELEDLKAKKAVGPVTNRKL